MSGCKCNNGSCVEFLVLVFAFVACIYLIDTVAKHDARLSALEAATTRVGVHSERGEK